MNKKRNRHSASFKSKVSLEAIKGEKTAAELISTHRITSGQMAPGQPLSTWKKQLLQGAPQIFENHSQKMPDQEAVTAPLYEEIGRLKMELDWIKKKLPSSVEAKRDLVEPDHEQISLRRQCELLELNRSSLYYQAIEMSQEELWFMKEIDRVYTSWPFYGSRKIAAYLSLKLGLEVNRKRIQRLMQVMGIRGLAPGPDTSKPSPEQKVYPYLLRNLVINRVNQVWSTDISVPQQAA